MVGFLTQSPGLVAPQGYQRLIGLGHQTLSLIMRLLCDDGVVHPHLVHAVKHTQGQRYSPRALCCAGWLEKGAGTWLKWVMEQFHEQTGFIPSESAAHRCTLWLPATFGGHGIIEWVGLEGTSCGHIPGAGMPSTTPVCSKPCPA